jgi:hypothetical protein
MFFGRMQQQKIEPRVAIDKKLLFYFVFLYPKGLLAYIQCPTYICYDFKNIFAKNGVFDSKHCQIMQKRDKNISLKETRQFFFAETRRN